MKISQRSLHTNSGTHVKYNKTKKTKDSSKKSAEKTSKDPNSSPEKLEEIKNEENRTTRADDNPTGEPKSELKKNQLEKRKQDSSEWKVLKKVDYRRLETVLEEGQLSSEETPTGKMAGGIGREESNKSETDSEIDQIVDFNYGRQRKAGIYELVAVSKKSDLWKNEDDIDQRERTSEKGDSMDEEKNQRSEQEIGKETEDKSVGTKINFSQSGLMEIFPIFSNDRFVCSRDAISIEECEEAEPLDSRRGSSPGAKREGATVVVSPLLENRLMETVNGLKEMNERKLHYKMLTDRTLAQKTSSHFINSLLILTPFADEREKITRTRHQSNLTRIQHNFHLENDGSDQIESDSMCEVKPLIIVICTTIGLFSVALGLAWKSYQPPCFIDYLLEFIPFLRPRRTYVQLFFDKLLKILSNIMDSCCK